MKLLVTGSNGFIGKQVCKWLKRKGLYIIGLGRNLESLAECDKYIQCDLFTEQINNLLDDTSVDAIVHLAADMRVEPFTSIVVANNCVGTQRLLEFAREKSISAFIQLSSLPVIGTPCFHPIKENHPIHPPTIYHITKYTQELLAEYANYTFGLRTVSLRISAPVGIGMNTKTIFPTFIDNALKNNDIKIYGKGTRKQTYIHAFDIAQAIHKSICSNAQGVYNLSSSNIVSNLQLGKICVDILNSKSKIVFPGFEDPDDDVCWDVSIEKLMKDTGYKPQISLEDAILEYAGRKQITI